MAGVAPILVAHRGGNTRRALRAALAARVDWIEVDVWLHYGRLVARHDPAVWRLPLTYSSRSLSLNLARPVVLEALIEATAASGTRLLVDLKGAAASLPDEIVRQLRHGGALGRSALCGQEWPPLERARALGDDVDVIFSLGQPQHLAAFLRRRREGTATSWTSCSHRLLTPESVAALKATGTMILAWTVDAEPRARALLDWGVDGIISNDYAMLGRLRDQPAERRGSGV